MNILSRIKNLINVCKVTAFQSGGWKVSLLDGEVISNVKHAQNFGIKSHAPVGSNGILLSRGGQKSGAFLIALQNEDGATSLSEGEVVIYNDHGISIHLKDDGNIEVKGGDIDLDGQVYKVDSTQVVGAQEPTVAPPTGGTVIDVEARAAIALLITRLQAHGLIA